MILGQSAATAAVMAIEARQPVQEVPYAKLRERLLADGQILEYKGGNKAQRGGRPIDKLEGVVVDESDARLTGNWTESSASQTFIGNGYRHDGNTRDGKASARFEAKLPEAGRYEVRLAYPSNPNRASNVQIDVRHATGTERITINQKKPAPIDASFVSLGTFNFTATEATSVSLSNAGTDGYVVIDAVQWVPVTK